MRLADAAEVGGKAASLGELMASGVRVPDGVVMTAVATADATPQERRWRTCRRRGGPRRRSVRRPLERRLRGRRRASFAGMYESVLGVPADELLEATDRVPGQRRRGPRRRYEPPRQTAAWR